MAEDTNEETTAPRIVTGEVNMIVDIDSPEDFLTGDEEEDD